MSSADPKLAGQVDRLLQPLRDLHSPVSAYAPASECDCQDRDGHETVRGADGEQLCAESPVGVLSCAECSDPTGAEPVAWPCATMQLINTISGSLTNPERSVVTDDVLDRIAFLLTVWGVDNGDWHHRITFGSANDSDAPRLDQGVVTPLRSFVGRMCELVGADDEITGGCIALRTSLGTVVGDDGLYAVWRADGHHDLLTDSHRWEWPTGELAALTGWWFIACRGVYIQVPAPSPDLVKLAHTVLNAGEHTAL